MTQLTSIKVAWNRRLDGKLSAIAEEDKAGYNKGDIVTVIFCEFKVMPKELSILPKTEQHAV